MSEGSVMPAWGTLSDRLDRLRRFRADLAASEGAISSLIAEEIGKPRWESLTADFMPALAGIRWAEKNARRLLQPRKLTGGGMLGMGQRHVVSREPLGRVAIIATWNYPVGLLGVQLAQALAAGNRVVVKPSEHCPRTQTALLEIAQRHLPENVLGWTEPTREAGAALLRDHDFDHVVFTGSTGVGRSIAEALAPSLTPSTLELSGRDSAFVLEDANLKVAARSIWFAATANSGQTCMAPKRVLVEKPIYQEFLRQIGLFAAGAAPKRIISEAAASEAWSQVERSLEAGARLLSGVPEKPEGAWMRPCAVVDCPPDAEVVAGRNFAPVFAVVPVDDVNQALEIHATCDQHLATSVFTRRTRWARAVLAPRLGAHTVTINDAIIPTAHPAASIGGVGASGWGESQGEAGLLKMTRPVSVSTTSTWLRPPLDVPSPGRLAMMVKWVGRMFDADKGTPIDLGSTAAPRQSQIHEAKQPHTSEGAPDAHEVQPAEAAT
ncbi:MAG: aldehyde dehydrogenase family protein [Planctomycetota bacterium]